MYYTDGNSTAVLNLLLQLRPTPAYHAGGITQIIELYPKFMPGIVQPYRESYINSSVCKKIIKAYMYSLVATLVLVLHHRFNIALYI